MKMISVKNESPVTTLFKYEITGPKITISLNDFKLTDSHLKKARNTIISAIILHNNHCEPHVDLKEIQIINKPEMPAQFLQLIQSQAYPFDITITPGSEKPLNFLFDQSWAAGITNTINTDTSTIEKMRTVLNNLNPDFSEKLFMYKTVSDNNKIQLRYKGYQVASWNSLKSELSGENNKDNLPLKKWINKLIKERSKTGVEDGYFETKAEHYLESNLLEKIYSTGLKLENYNITKPFKNCDIAFQFPALFYSGNAGKDNSPKYIDIVAKHEDRPVIFELKVWKQKGTSRGEYIFEGLSQLFCYYSFYFNIWKKNEFKAKGLDEIQNLKWDNPVLILMVNNIGDDKKAEEFRSYFEQVKKYLNANIEFKFIEFDNQPWDDNREIRIKGVSI